MLDVQIKFAEGKYWTLGEDEHGPYETEVTSWKGWDSEANGFKWGLKYKTAKQRKFRISSAMSNSLVALLGLVEFKLKEGQEVVLTTLDINIEFFM